MKVEVERAPGAEPGVCVWCDRPILGSLARDPMYCSSTCRSHHSKFWAWYREAKRPQTLPERQRGLSRAQRRAARYIRRRNAGESPEGPPPRHQTVSALWNKTDRIL